MPTQKASKAIPRTGPSASRLTATVCPFVIVADTREQLDYTFKGFRADAKHQRRPIDTDVMIKTLKPGDYSYVGGEHIVRIERKSPEDLFGTIGRSRERFAKRLAEMNKFPIARVVVEAAWMEIVCFPPIYSSLRHKNIFRTVHAWQCEYPMVQWWFLPTRRFAEEVVFRMLYRAWELQRAGRYG